MKAYYKYIHTNLRRVRASPSEPSPYYLMLYDYTVDGNGLLNQK